MNICSHLHDVFLITFAARFFCSQFNCEILFQPVRAQKTYGNFETSCLEEKPMRLLPGAFTQFPKNKKIVWGNLLWVAGLHIVAFTTMFVYFSWSAFATFFICYVLTGLFGITLCFHRLLAHKSFKSPVWFENLLALCGTLACQKGPISWVGAHRIHHAYSDKEGDPHNSTKGFWYSHVIWTVLRREDLDTLNQVSKYCPDLAKRKFMVFLNNNMILLQTIFAAGLLVLGGLVAKGSGFNWHNALAFVIWGVAVRLVVVYHVTWFVNSACHKWGSRPNKSHDKAHNLWWVALLTFGEGWHNNHHAQPRAAKSGWKWYQIDLTWFVILTLKMLHLAKDIKMPDFGKSTEAQLAEVEKEAS